MIVAVCSDKGAPGGTTVAMTLGMVWPGVRAVVETDVAGGDLALRVRATDSGQFLTATPSLASLSTAVRMGEVDPALHAQDTSLGVPVIVGSPSAVRFRAVRSTWPAVAACLADWSGTAIADLGRVDGAAASVPVAKSASLAVLVTRFSVEGLARLRDRVDDPAVLPAATGDGRSRVAVVVVAPSRQAGEAIAGTRQVLDSIGSPVPVVGAVAWDPAAAAALWEGTVTRRLAGSELIRSTRSIAESMLSGWPELAGAVVNAADGGGMGSPPTRPAGRSRWTAGIAAGASTVPVPAGTEASS
jgi:hypothetical protein